MATEEAALRVDDSDDRWRVLSVQLTAAVVFDNCIIIAIRYNS